MSTKVVNKRFARPREGDVYIGRPGEFGNPFKLELDTEDGRLECILKFQRYFIDRLASDQHFNAAVRALEGKRLVCWCRPHEGFRGRLLCHGQVIAAWCDNLDDPAEVP